MFCRNLSFVIWVITSLGIDVEMYDHIDLDNPSEYSILQQIADRRGLGGQTKANDLANGREINLGIPLNLFTFDVKPLKFKVNKKYVKTARKRREEIVILKSADL